MFASTLRMRPVIVETDTALVAKMVFDPAFDRSALGSLTGEIIKSLIYKMLFLNVHVSRV